LEVSGQLHAQAALFSAKELPVIGYVSELAPEPVWMIWRIEIVLPYLYSNSDPSVVQPLKRIKYTEYLLTSCATIISFWGRFGILELVG
jgi:hypothetical protein